MANKTQPNDSSVESFLNSVEDEQKRKDAWQVLNMMKDITGYEPVLWGASIVGFGSYHYKYDSGREGDFLRVGFSPRKSALTLYIMPGFDRYQELMAKLGKFKTGKSCLYLKNLSDVDEKVLRDLIKESVAYMNEKYPVN